jgi:hypothetical protein
MGSSCDLGCEPVLLSLLIARIAPIAFQQLWRWKDCCLS